MRTTVRGGLGRLGLPPISWAHGCGLEMPAGARPRLESAARRTASWTVWRPLVTRDTARVLMARWQAAYLRSFLRVEVEEVTGTPDEPVGRMWYVLLDRTVAEYPLYLGVY